MTHASYGFIAQTVDYANAMATNDPTTDRHSLMAAIQSALVAGASSHDEDYERLFASNPLPIWVYDVDSLEFSMRTTPHRPDIATHARSSHA